MDFGELIQGFRLLWENKPWTCVLFCLGFILFLYLVVDTWRHRRRRKRPR